MEFDFDKINGRYTFIDEVNNKRWKNWKNWDDLTDKDKEEMNLGMPARKYIIFDVDMKEASEEEILFNYNEFKIKLMNKGINSFLADRSPHGFHIYAPFKNLETLDEDLITELRRIFVQGFGADEAKVSLNGVIAIPGKPHFKTMKTYPILDYFEGMNELKQSTIRIAKENLENAKKTLELINKIAPDQDFKNYFVEDPFWLYLMKRKDLLPLGTSRNNIVLKNLAIACAKSGLTNEQIQEKIQDLLNRLMPDIPYKVFEGWYKKALTGELKEYNQWEINKWGREYSNETSDIYDLKGIILNLNLDEDIKNLILELQNPNKTILLEEKDEIFKRIAKIKDVVIREYLVGKIAYALMVSKKTIFEEIKRIEKGQIEVKIISAFALSEKQITANEYLIDKVLPKGKTLLIGGKGGKGKSFFILSMCCSLKTEKKYLGKYDNLSDPSILYYDLENGEDRNALRMKYLLKGKKFNPNATPFDFTFSFDKKSYEAEINKCKPYDIIVLDAFRRFLDGSENDSEITNNFYLEFMKKLQEMGKTVLVVHHLKKVKLDDMEDEDLLDAFRGSSDIVASFDGAYLITKGNESISLDNNVLHYNLAVNMGVKNRDGNILENLMIEVTKDDKEMKTTFKASDHKKMLTYKDKVKARILEIIGEEDEMDRKELFGKVSEEFEVNQRTLVRYVEELTQTSKIFNPRYGYYSIVKQIQKNKETSEESEEEDSQETL